MIAETIVVTYDPSQVIEQNIIQAVEDAGFTVSGSCEL